MKLMIVENQYFPPAVTFAYALQTGVVQLEAHETYQKGGYRARCRIAAANGPMTLSVPLVKGKNQQQAITQTRIAYRQDWVAVHWQSIRSAYGRSPYFAFYADTLQQVLFQRYELLYEMNKALWQTLIQLMQLPISLEETERFHKKYSDDAGHLDLRGQITYRQADPARMEGQLPAYVQVFSERHGFLPDLSILDLLFCTGPEAVRYLSLTGSAR